jgi:hypothetical protein
LDLGNPTVSGKVILGGVVEVLEVLEPNLL